LLGRAMRALGFSSLLAFAALAGFALLEAVLKLTA
jgi:hypothetical protein